MDRYADNKDKLLALAEQGDDMLSALVSTEKLFGRLAAQTVKTKGYKYPQKAENYAKTLLEEVCI